MVFVRFILLLFLTLFSYSMGRAPPHELNDFGKFVSALFFLAAPALYLLPTYEAWANKKSDLTAVALVNIFLGWSAIGWIVAMVWAHKRPALVYTSPAPNPGAGKNSNTKICPMCAEEVMAAARKCKHCGSSLEAAAPT